MTQLPPIVSPSFMKTAEIPFATTTQVIKARAKNKKGLRTVDISDDTSLQPTVTEDNQRHSIALEMLVSGYIEAYIEFFNITESKIDWHDDTDILHVLQLNLARAEESRRKADQLLACNSYNQLAAFFESAGDKETAAHFYEQCLKAINQTAENFQKKSEVYAQIGLLAEQRGDLQGSREAFAEMYEIASSNGVKGQFGQPSACRHLVRVTVKIVDKLESSGEWAASVALLERNLLLAKASKADDLLPDTDFRLGCAYEKIDEFALAVEHLERFVDSAANEVSRAKACTSLARCYEKLGDLDSAIQFLTQLVASGIKSGQLNIAANASSCLGAITLRKRQYESSVKFYKQAFELYQSLNNAGDIAQARVKYGIAFAHLRALSFTSDVSSNRVPKLLTLKSSAPVFQPPPVVQPPPISDATSNASPEQPPPATNTTESE